MKKKNNTTPIVEEMDVAAPVLEEIQDDVLVIPSENVVKYSVGDAVKLAASAVYTSGAAVPQDIINSKLYIRQVLANDTYAVGIKTTGKIAGNVNVQYISAYEQAAKASEISNAYAALVKAENVIVRSRPDVKANNLKTIKFNAMVIITEEKGDWGHLLNGGWISLHNIKKIGA